MGKADFDHSTAKRDPTSRTWWIITVIVAILLLGMGAFLMLSSK